MTKSQAPTHEKHTFPWYYFMAALALFCLGHWIGTLALHWVEHAIPAFQHNPLWLAGLSLVLLAGVSMLMHHAHHVCPRPKAWRDRAWQFTLAVGVLVSAFFVTAGLEHWLLHGPLHLVLHVSWFALACLVALVGTERAFRKIQIRQERPHDVRPLLHLRHEAAEPVEALILFVSTPTPGVNLEVIEGGEAEDRHASVTFKDGKTATLGGKGHLEADIDSITAGGFWNWQQLLRAVRGHSTLRQVILLGSKSERGSHTHLDKCLRFLKPYLPEGCEIQRHAKPLDFTHFNELVESLRGIILNEFKAFSMNRIAIDVTGGQTTASIAGAATTMNLDCLFQYVDTNPPFEVLTYDVLHEGGPRPH